MRAVTSGYIARNSTTTGSTWSRPNTTGAVTSKLALRLGMLPGETEIRGIELGDDAAACLEVVPAGLGEREVPRRPRDEAHADLGLERRQMPADRRQWHAEAPPRRGEAASFGNRDEDLDGGESVHFALP